MPVKRIDIQQLLPAIASNATILVPNHRMRDALLSSYANAVTTQVVRTPHIVAIDIWIRELWDTGALSGLAPFCDWQLLSSSEELFIWTDTIEKSLDELPLLNPEETARVVNQSYRDLKQWLPDKPLALLQQFTGTPDVAAFLQWIMAYQQFGKRQKLINLVDSIELMLALSDENWRTLPSLPSDIFLVNFLETPPLYSRLFSRLKTLADVTELQLGRDTVCHDSRRVTFPDQTSELVACANWARALRVAEPDSHIGIIYNTDLLSQPSLRHLLASILSDESELIAPDIHALFNSSGSRQNLLDTALVHDAFLLLNLGNEQQRSNDLCRLLQSPFLIAASAEREARLQMELQMRRNFTATAYLSDLSWHLQQAERPTHAPLLATALLEIRTRTRQAPATASAREWALHIAAILSDCGWPGLCQTPADARTLKSWQDTLREFASLNAVLGKVSFTTALARLRTLCSQQALESPFLPANPLSIYSVTEAIGLQFDHVWMPGFSAQAWPPSAHPSPFIPYALQREAGIPGSNSDIQLQQARQQFELLQASVSGQLVASFHAKHGELEYNASSFIANWPEQQVVAASTAPHLLARAGHNRVALIHVDDLAQFPLQAQESVRGGQSIISNQSSCPFRAFATHRLQAQPLEAFATGLSMRDRGSALHQALEILFSDIDSLETLQTLTVDARSHLIDQAATHAIDYLSRQHRELMTPRFRQLEHLRIANLLRRFLELESSREAFRVVAREQAMQWQHDKLELRLKIDRIDELEDNSLVLIDYKSGKHTTSNQRWIEERPEDMQLPLYYTVATEAQPQTISALAIAHVNVERIAYSGLAAAANLHHTVKPVSEDRSIQREWQDITGNWQENVRQRAEEFVAGQAQVAPVHGRRTCQYCGLDSLCRIQELDASEPDEAADGESET